MGAPKGRPKPPGSGRKKGAANQFTVDVKKAILGALEAKGGQEWLEAQMESNPTAFMTLLGKVLPTQIQGDPDAPLHLAVKTIELIPLAKRTDKPT